MESGRILLLLGALGIIVAAIVWVGLALTGLGRGYLPCANWGCCCVSVIFIVAGAALLVMDRR